MAKYIITVNDKNAKDMKDLIRHVQTDLVWIKAWGEEATEVEDIEPYKE
jgi:hypothetical protein